MRKVEAAIRTETINRNRLLEPSPRPGVHIPAQHTQPVTHGIPSISNIQGRLRFKAITASQLPSQFSVDPDERSRAQNLFNPLTPNDPYSGRTAPLPSKRCILYIYLSNIGTEYFKHGIYSPFFFSLFKMQFVS